MVYLNATEVARWQVWGTTFRAFQPLLIPVGVVTERKVRPRLVANRQANQAGTLL